VSRELSDAPYVTTTSLNIASRLDSSGQPDGRTEKIDGSNELTFDSPA
jgi:hypothetical protein